jgi:hypothetical protein
MIMVWKCVLTSLLLAGSAAAQESAIAPDLRFSTTHAMQSNGRIREVVTDNDTVAIAAFRIQFRCPPNQELFFYYDSVVNPGANPVIAARTSKSMELPEVPAGCSMMTDGVLFADGSAFTGRNGAALGKSVVQDSLDGIRARRIDYLTELYGLEPVLLDVLTHRMTMEAAVKWIKTHQSQVEADQTRTGEDQAVARVAIQGLLAEIDKQHPIQPMVPHSYEVTGPQDVNILNDSVRAARVNDWLQNQKVAVLQSLAAIGVPQLRQPIRPPLQ